MSRLDTLKSAIKEPPGEGLGDLHNVVHTRLNSTQELSDAMGYASFLMTEELTKYRDLYYLKSI